MAISGINTTSSTPEAVSSIFGNAAATTVSNAQNAEQQASAVVSISKQGQALSQTGKANQAQQSSQAQAANNSQSPQTAENRETRPGEAAEKPGIQLLEGDKNSTPNQGNRVNTYA